MSKVYPKGHGDDVLAQLTTLRRYARALIRDESAAEDLVHDALVRAYERRTTFRLDGNLRAWLLSILHNTFIDNCRRRHAEQRREAEAAQLVESSRPGGQESHVRLQQIQCAFWSLPEDQRAVLHLVAIEELAYQEAADALGIPIGTLMSRLGRARAALRMIENDRGSIAPPGLQAPQTAQPRLKLRVVGGKKDG